MRVLNYPVVSVDLVLENNDCIKVVFSINNIIDKKTLNPQGQPIYEVKFHTAIHYTGNLSPVKA